MSSMGGITVSQSGMLPVYERTKISEVAPAADKAPKLDADTGAPVEGVKVTISGAALKTASAQKSQDNDIAESGLSDQVQKILKMIRELKKQIAEKQAQLQQVMTNKSLSPEQANAQASALQSAISVLNAALMTAISSLNEAMKDSSADDAVKASSLAAK
ncbi:MULTISPECIES: hypothetical protein [Pseudomonas]|jgi:hypothetical protein|uniref:hypothetical protein n=1 Tax=Pseudomonas TaxID=286 RepID=UPI00076C050E|nr:MULTISPECIES: hypothetical protein [Pseudomonas]KVV02449.1 hypothetical protein AP060_02988 [Pseudomonas sp. TAD18]KVV04918.1 hypothetical protein AP059_02971 [Pseudomonas sp. TAA207]